MSAISRLDDDIWMVEVTLDEYDVRGILAASG